MAIKPGQLHSIFSINGHALAHVAALCHSGCRQAACTPSNYCYTVWRRTVSAGLMEASCSDQRGQAASHNCSSCATATEPMRNAALELKPRLAQRISAPVTPHWGGQQRPRSPVASGGTGHPHTQLLSRTPGYTVTKITTCGLQAQHTSLGTSTGPGRIKEQLKPSCTFTAEGRHRSSHQNATL